MIEVTQTEFRQSIKKYSDMAIDEDKIIKITSVKHRNLIVMSEDTFKTLMNNGEKYDKGLYVGDTFQLFEDASTEDKLNSILKTYAKEIMKLRPNGDN